MNHSEKLLVEAISNLLRQDAQLGLDIKDETSHFSQFRWEGIGDAFALKVGDSPFAESITSAFYAVHSCKYIDNPTFELSLVKEMTARAVPTAERELAIKYLNQLKKDLSTKDAGWNPEIDEIADMTRNADTREAKPSKPFTGGGPAPEGDRP